MDNKIGSRHIFQKWISDCLLYLPYLLFFILLLLCFFCRPSAEDLAINYYSTNPGISGFIKSFYLKEGSRYISFPLVTIICHSRFMLEHYWILPLVLMLLFWYILRTAVKFFIRFLNKPISNVWISWLSTILFLTFCSVIFEMSSFFYWMSGSITYLPSFLLFILLVIFLQYVLLLGQPKMIHFAVAILLVFCISGTNEIALYFLILFLIWALCLFYSIKRKLSRILLVCLFAGFICLLFLILPSGISHRAGNYRLNFSVFQAFIVSLGYTARIMFHAVSSPFAWLTMSLAVVAGFHTNDPVKKKLTGRILFAPRLIFPLLCAVVFFFYFMIYLFSGELLAPRAQNLIMTFVFSFLLVCSYSYGLGLDNSFTVVEKFYQNSAFQLLIIIAFISSSFMHETIYNAFTGIIYNRVMKDRTVAIHSAHYKNRQSVVLRPYSEDFAGQGKKMLPPFVYNIMKKKLMNYPDWMHFQDPVQDTALYIHYYAEYHHIDTIWFLGMDYERIGLMVKENQK
jgi:hypothetical protein